MQSKFKKAGSLYVFKPTERWDPTHHGGRTFFNTACFDFDKKTVSVNNPIDNSFHLCPGDVFMFLGEFRTNDIWSPSIGRTSIGSPTLLFLKNEEIFAMERWYCAENFQQI